MSGGIILRAKRESIGLSQAKLSELANIPQYLLSAFELGKMSLAESEVITLNNLLDDISETNVQKIKKKRYQVHTYNPTFKDESRASRICKTDENHKYLKLINSFGKDSNPKSGKVISLFSGCGGFSLGFSQAGFSIAGFLELKKSYKDIYRENFKNAVEIGSDIQEFKGSSISQWRREFGDVDIIIGGPPCQGFSLSGKRDSNDPRNTLFKNYIRVVRGIMPKVAVMENVRLLTSMKSSDGDLILKSIYEDFEESGYQVKHFEVNAKDYGIPQHRERVIFVAVRNDLGVLPSIPEKTHGESNNLFSKLKSFRTFADACSDLEFLESGEKSKTDSFHEAVKHPDHVIEWLWDVPQGKSAHENKDSQLRPPSGYNTTYKRQVWNEPASTVQTTFGMISGCRNVHPIATRSLTIREAARIQSFPDSFKFIGSLGDIRSTIGNAVPPLLAYEIAKHIKSKFLNPVKISRL